VIRWRRHPKSAPQPVPSRYPSSATLLALAYAGLVVYASLYPFTGWRIGSVGVFSFWAQPLPPYWTGFDLVANWLGYIPIGLLLFIALIRQSWRPSVAVVMAMLLGATLSSTLEFLQNFLPQRVPSNVDAVLNASGALIGAVMGWLLHRWGGIARWQTVRERWFMQPSAGGIALLCVWPVGLLFPLSFPFAMGQVVERLREGLVEWLSDTVLADWALASLPPPVLRALTPTGEFVLIALGLLGPCCLVLAVSNSGWRRRVLLLAMLVAGVSATSLSTALSYGPEHAWAWTTSVVWWAVATAGMLAFLLSWVSRRAVAAVGLMTLAALVALVTQAPSDPYFALNLQSWEQGRFIRFHGAAQWVGWFWPFVAMAYLMSLVAGRYPARGPVRQHGSAAPGQAPVGSDAPTPATE
jgi:VanZ family protein